MSKKIVAMLMAVAMAFSLLPVTALAGNPSLLSITQPGAEKFATYEFYISETAESPWYTQTVKTGDTLKPPADPTLAGSHFTGWKTADGKEVPFGTVTVKETSIIKCYAKWEENKNPIHVYFMAAIGSNEVMHTGVAQNGAVDIPPDYQDITWKTEKNETFDRTNVTKDMKVYPASASCWLTFDSQGGSAIASHYVQQGESFELGKVGNPEKAGYTFAGWSLEANGTKQTEVTPNGDTKLYALWTLAKADYTVIHWQENANDDGYSFKESQKLSGKTDGQTNATAKSYKGFTATEIKQQTISGDGSTIVNVYYQRNSYTIHFYYREYVSWKEYTDIQITAKHGADISKQWPEIKGSKTWSTTKKLSDGPFQANIQTMPLGGAKYYGPKTGTTFESAQYYVEVLPGEDGTVTRGDVTYKLHHTDTSPGYGLKVSDEDKYPLTGFTYKEGTRNGSWYDNAKFYYTRKSYDVVYVNGAEVKKEPYKYEQDIRDAGNYKPDNAPDGYEFGGWYSDPIGTKKYDFSGKKMPAQHITVYAKWVPITLTLTIQGVDDVNSGEVNYKQVINEAGVYKQATDKLTAANKTVLYWVTSTGERVDVSSQMTKNLTIRPVLKGDTYTVTYTGGATNSDAHSYWYNTKSKVQEYSGEKTDKFLCWVDGNNQKYHPGDEILMTANVTLTARFSGNNQSPTKYTVTYHSNFGTDQTYPGDSIENYKQFFTKTYTETGLPSQNGYKFTGWNTQSDGGGTSFAAGGPALMNGANDNDLYAQWQPCTYTLTYDANGGQFGSGDSAPTTKQESDIRAGNHPLKYSQEYTPTHAKSEGKNVVFLGWSEKDDSEKIYDKGDTIPNLIQSVTMDGNKTVYAVWGYDAIGKDNKPDGVPDVFNAVVTYNIVGGTWDGTNNSATEFIKVKEFNQETKEWTDTNNTLDNIPDTKKVTPDKDHTSSGSWGDSDSTPAENTVVTADKIYTYTLSEVTTGTLTITKKVVGDGLTVDSLPKNFQITVKDAQGETKGTLTKTDKAKKADDTLTWTIRDLTPGTYTVSESNADVKDYTYTTTYNNVAATQANPATVTVAVNATKTMTVTNTYTKNATVDLSQLIQKQLTLKDGSTLPDNTTFGVTVTPKTVNNQDVISPQLISGTVSNLGTGTQNEAGDTTYTALFTFTNGTLSLPAGTYTYTVQETPGNVSGMQYDSKEYTLTIKVENSKASVQYTTKEGATSEVSTTKPLTIKNTYQTPYLSVTKQPYKVKVNDTLFDADKTVAHVGDTIVWEVSVTNNKNTQASTQLKDTLGDVAVYSDKDLQNSVNLGTDGTWTARVPANTTVPYYVTYTVKPEDISNGKIVNAIVKDGDNNIPSAPVSTWDTKQLKSATGRLETSDWTTTVTLTLPTVNSKPGTQSDQTIAISKGSYVIDKIGKQFTFMDGLSLEKNNVKIPMQKKGDTYYFGENATEQSYLYKLTYTERNGEEAAQFNWEINENIPAETTVTLSYKLKLDNPNKTAGTHGVTDLDGDGKVDGTDTAVDTTKALYTNESAILYKKEGNTKLADFPKPSVSYTVSSGNSGSHSGGSRPSLNTKDHYGYIIGYPVDYYTGQPTTDQTKKPVRPEGKITRAEVATIYFRMLTDESRTKFWSQSSGYSDVKTGDWFNNAVSTLSNAGIIAGYEDGSFRPNGYITRAEFATIAARFFDVTYNGKDLFPDISGHWAKDYINQAANKGFVNGYEDGTFKPDRNITRAEAVTLVNRTLDRHPDKNHFTKDMLVWPDNMDQTKWYYADMQEATNSHTYQMKENSDKTKYENWTKTLPIRNWEALEKAWSNANSSQGNGNVV